MLMPEIPENDIIQKKKFNNEMAPLKEEEENNDMNMDSDNDKENKDKMVIDTKIEVENQSPAIPKFNANSNSTPDIASSTNNAYTKFNNKSTQKYVFHSKVNNSTFGQNNFSNVKKTTQIHPLINNKNNLTKNKNLGNMSLFQNRQNKNKLENKHLNNRKFLSNNPLISDSIIEEEEEDVVSELPTHNKLDLMNIESPKKPASPSFTHKKVGYGSSINKLINTPPNTNTFPYNIKLNHPNINAGPFPHNFKNYKSTYGNKINLNFGSTSSLLNKLKSNSFNKTQQTTVPDSSATQIKTKLEKKAKINNNKPTKTFNTLTTISENPKIQPINTITIPEEIPEEEEEDAMETEENLNNKTEIIMEEERVMDTIKEEEEEEEEEKEKIEEKRVIDTIKEEEEEEEKEEEKVEEKVEEKRVIDTIKEEEEEKEKEEAKESKIESNQNVASSNPVNPLITPNMNQLQQQQLQQKQLQLQLQQQFQQQLQQQQLQQHQHNNLINMLQQQTQQRRQLQQEQQQRQMEEQEKQIREEQKLVVPPIVPSTINPLLMNNSSNFDRSLNLNSIIILQTLGTGTFGRVHLVRSKDNGKYYAMKAIKKSCVVSNHQVEHTMNEKKILENVRHPFFVRLQNTFQDSSHIFFITDYVCGGELFTCLRRYQRFPNNVAKFYAAEVIVAFDYLHSMDIIYRDLKPENILLDNTGHIKIIDFGFAKYVPDITYTLCGTPEYLAPEAIQMKAYGKSVDWYTLGILIYEMLCGFPPFYDDDRVKLYKKILAGKIYWPDHINPVVKNLLKHLITSDLTNRYGNLKGGSEDIKNHLWFAGVDWNKVARLEITPPFIPNVRYEGDAGHFESYPEVNVSYGEEGEDPYQDLFKDF
jgi:protein kinase A